MIVIATILGLLFLLSVIGKYAKRADSTSEKPFSNIAISPSRKQQVARRTDQILPYKKVNFVEPSFILLPKSIEHCLLGLEVVITYFNSDEIETTRKVRIEKVFHNGRMPPGMYAHCFLRNETRTFYFNRIGNVVDENTGELFRSMYEFSLRKAQSDPEETINAFISDHKDQINVIVYCARFDGYMRRPERELICKYIESGVKRDSLFLDRMIDEIKPSQHIFSRSLNNISKLAKSTQLEILTICEDILELKKKPSAAETELLQKIQATLKQ